MNKRKDVKWKYLPSRYYTHGLYIEGIRNFSEENQAGLWWENKSDEEKENTFIVEDLKVHHANWAKGLDNKLELLDFIFNKKERGK